MTITQPQDCFVHLGPRDLKQKRRGVWLKAITGSHAQLCLIRLEAGTATEHRHDGEQMGYVLSGNATLVMGSTSRRLGPADAYCIPFGTYHSFSVSPESDLLYLEVFCPPKAENAL